MADSSNLETEFNTAVAHDRDAYKAARDAILRRGEAALGFVEAKQTSAEWDTALTAWILAGWLKNRDLFQKCTDAIQGHFPGPRPITGKFPAKRRIAEVSRLGTPVTPRLLEMALKTKEVDAPEETEAVFGSLVALKDPRAVVPLIKTMEISKDEMLREWSASTLGPMRDQRAVKPLLDVLRNAAAPEMLRASAAISLGTLEARDAIPSLRAIAADVSANMGFRKAAVEAISDLGDAGSAEGLLRTLAGTDDQTFQLQVLIAVGDIGAANVLPALKSIEHSHADEAVRDAAKEARERIEERAGIKEE